jgi:hypothetical protein
MVLPLADPGRAPALQSWALRQLASFYPTIRAGLPNAAGQIPANGLDFGAFGDNLALGLS